MPKYLSKKKLVRDESQDGSQDEAYEEVVPSENEQMIETPPVKTVSISNISMK